MKACRSCGEKIRFVCGVSGRWIPVNTRPSLLNGNIVVERGQARVVGGHELLKLREEHCDLFISHFETCPDAPSHRRRRPNQGLVELRERPKRQLELGV